MQEEPIRTPITDKLESEIEAAGKRDVPVRVYQQMRVLESNLANLLLAVKPFYLMKKHHAPRGFSSTVWAEKLGKLQTVVERISK